MSEPPARWPRRTTSRKSSGEVRRLQEESTPGCSRLRRRGGRGPCGVGRREWSGRRESASGDGSRGSCADGGCSAGTCACSTYSLHSRGLGQQSATGSCRANNRQLRVNWHRAPTRDQVGQGTVMDMRHRSTPVETCQRYVFGLGRVNSNHRVGARPHAPRPPTDRCCGSSLCRTAQAEPTQARVARRHADAWGCWRPCLWTTVDPQARRLLSSNLRTAPPTTNRPSRHCAGRVPRSRPIGSCGQGHKEPPDCRGITGIPKKRDIL